MIAGLPDKSFQFFKWPPLIVFLGGPFSSKEGRVFEDLLRTKVIEKVKANTQRQQTGTGGALLAKLCDVSV